MMPYYTPENAIINEKNRKMGLYIKYGITGLILIINILTVVYRDSGMAWSCIPVDANGTAYNNLQIIGLTLLLSSVLVLVLVKKAFINRIHYLMESYQQPPGSRIERHTERDVEVLKGGIYWVARDPETLVFHWFTTAMLLISQSWLQFTILCIVWFLQELGVARKDVLWRRWFGIPSYQEYAKTRGGQWTCMCLNGFDEMICEKVESRVGKREATNV